VRDNYKFRRRNYFIKKRFQTKFSVYFLALVISELFLIGALFLYVARNTITAAYLLEGLKIERTVSFFFMSFIIISLFVAVTIGFSALAVFIYLSHRMAGPLYRFEKSLNDLTANGDLCYRIRLRRTDQFEELQNGLNSFIKSMDDRIGAIKEDITVILKMLKQEKIDTDQLKEVCEKLKDKLEFFKTSKQ